MNPPTINYDEPSDTLYITFIPNQKATGLELNDHILLRLNKQKGKAIGLTLLNYSLLTQKTDMGPRSFPLTGLATLSTEMREIILNILQTPPLNTILTLSAYTPSIKETIPITLFQDPLNTLQPPPTYITA